jgi:hypothetical protein
MAKRIPVTVSLKGSPHTADSSVPILQANSCTFPAVNLPPEIQNLKNLEVMDNKIYTV